MNPQPAAQIPGVYHRKIGDIVVTTISDGYLDGTLEVMRNVDVEKARQILTDAFRPARRTSVNTFLIHSKGRIAIVDTGSGNYLQPTAGFVQRNLACGRHRSEVDRYGVADPHASGSFRRPDRHVERAASVSERGTCDARERTGALVRRRRDGQGRRAIGTTLFSGRPRTGRALQEAGRDCSGRARCFPA